jgi:biofilm PGA synthesis N-glycosyltransferase PgaC
MTFLLIIIALIYAPAIGWLILGALRLPRFQSSNTHPITKFSIIIPFRNEEMNLPALLKSIEHLAYPTEFFEVILVNDASEDNGEHILQKLAQESKLQLLILQNKRISASPKKDAIRTAMEQTKHEWIITTDADCELPKNWLRCFDQQIRNEVPNMICGPVVYKRNRSLLGHFQFLDGLSLQGVAMGSFGWSQPILCNGANLAYKKSVFEAVEGYKYNDHIASGDDIFLLEKIQTNYPNTVYYLNSKEAVVLTKPENNWSQAIQQRIRWASKTAKQKNTQSKVLGIIVLLGNLAFIASLFLFAWDSRPVYLLMIILGLKIAMDLTLLRVVGQLLGKPISFLHFLVNTIIYPLLTLWIVVNSITGNYQWKGRKFKK